jgi:hypothetical protein
MTVARNLRKKHNATLTERRYKNKGAAGEFRVPENFQSGCDDIRWR